MKIEDKKIRITQQALNPSGIGGVSSEFRALQNSNLNEEYNFIPMILTKCHKGINIKDILFYFKELKKNNPDIVHIRGAAVDGLNAIIAAKIYGRCKILLSVHGMYSDLIYVSKTKKFIAKYIVEFFSFKLVDGISCVCFSAEKRDVFSKYRKKMLPFVYNRIPNWTIFDKPTIRERLRKQYNFQENDIIGLYCGRITKEKGLYYLVESLLMMKSQWPDDFKVIIVGDGDYLKEMKTLLKDIAKNIFFVGSQTNVYRYYLASDFLIQPSLHENHSIAILEACAAKIPSIVTNVGGNSEIIEHLHSGIIIPSQNSQELFNAIQYMLLNKKFLIEAGEIAYLNAYKKFNDTVVDSQLRSVYESLIKE